MKNEIKMEVNASAKWNERKGIWEVSIFEYETKENLFGDLIKTENKYFCEIALCDEFVIPQAILQMHGVK